MIRPCFEVHAAFQGPWLTENCDRHYRIMTITETCIFMSSTSHQSVITNHQHYYHANRFFCKRWVSPTQQGRVTLYSSPSLSMPFPERRSPSVAPLAEESPPSLRSVVIPIIYRLYTDYLSIIYRAHRLSILVK